MEKIIYLEKGEEPKMPENASEEQRLDVAVKWINRKVESTVHFGLIQIGYYLLNNFFAGSLDEALSRNPHKHHSFRKLCRRPDLLISSTHLVNAVKLVAQEKALAGETAFQKLGVSHKIALLPVADAREKRSLARRALDEGLSVRALGREVAKLRESQPRAEMSGDRWARQLRARAVATLRLLESPSVDGISPVEARALDQALSALRQKLQGALANLRGIRSLAS